MAGVFQPGIVFQQSHPGRRDKAHFRRHMSGLLAAVPEFFRQVPVEENNDFTHRQGQLCRAEREHVHPCLPGDLFWRYPQGGDGIGEAGAVHVEVEVVPAGESADCRHLVHTVHRTHFRRLGDGYCPVYLVMKIKGLAQDPFDLISPDFSVRAIQRFHPRAAGEKRRTAAFGSGDMGLPVADDPVLRPADAGQGQ